MKKNFPLILVPFLILGSTTGCKAKKNNTSSTSQPSIVETDYKVSKDEYVHSFEELKKEDNITCEMNLNISMSENGVNNSINETTIQKIDNKKLASSSSALISTEYGEEFFEEVYKEANADTDEEKLEVYNEVVKELVHSPFKVLEKRENYLKTGFSYIYDEEYSEFDTANELFVYDYRPTDYEDDQYYKSKQFIEDSSVYLMDEFYEVIDTFANEDFYNLFTFDTATNTYRINDFISIFSLFDLPEGIDLSEVDTGCVEVKFEDKKITSFAIKLDGGDNGVIFDTISFKDRGQTHIALPTNILSCEHEAYTHMFYDTSSDYHYSECSECRSVLNYEKHEYYHDVCIKCSRFASVQTTEKNLDLGSEHESSHFGYDVKPDGAVVGAFTSGMHSTYTSSGDYVYTCLDDECDLTIIEKVTQKKDPENQCMKIRTYSYQFFHGEDTTPFKEFSYDSYSTDHNMTNSSEQDPDNACLEICSMACENCGISSTYKVENHNYSTSYSSEGCTQIDTETCSKCNKNIVYKYNIHKLLTIGECVDGLYQCHCDECGADVEYEYDFRSENNRLHRARNQETYDYGFYPHTYDENDCCIYCGFEKPSDYTYTTELLYSYFEGTEYIALTKNSAGDYVEIDWSGFDWEYSSELGGYKYHAFYSDYNFDVRDYYEDEKMKHDYVIRKGNNVVLSFTIVD